MSKQVQAKTAPGHASRAKKPSAGRATKQAAPVAQASVTRLLEAIKTMSSEHEAGDIEVFLPEAEFTGPCQEIARRLNELVASHISVKKKAMACVAEFSIGNFDAPLE